MSGIDLTTSLPASVINASTTLWLGVFAPYIELILGILVAFYILKVFAGWIYNQSPQGKIEKLESANKYESRLIRDVNQGVKNGVNYDTIADVEMLE